MFFFTDDKTKRKEKLLTSFLKSFKTHNFPGRRAPPDCGVVSSSSPTTDFIVINTLAGSFWDHSELEACVWEVLEWLVLMVALDLPRLAVTVTL